MNAKPDWKVEVPAGLLVEASREWWLRINVGFFGAYKDIATYDSPTRDAMIVCGYRQRVNPDTIACLALEQAVRWWNCGCTSCKEWIGKLR